MIRGIGAEYLNFGIQLLHDPNGNSVEAIKDEFCGNCGKINVKHSHHHEVAERSGA